MLFCFFVWSTHWPHWCLLEYTFVVFLSLQYFRCVLPVLVAVLLSAICFQQSNTIESIRFYEMLSLCIEMIRWPFLPLFPYQMCIIAIQLGPDAFSCILGIVMMFQYFSNVNKSWVILVKDFLSQIVLVWIWCQNCSSFRKWTVKYVFSHVCKHMYMCVEANTNYLPLMLSILFFNRGILTEPCCH